MVHTRRLFSAAVSLCFLWPGLSRAESVSRTQYMEAVTEMITELAPRSADAAATIRGAYRSYVDVLALESFDSIEDGLATGGLVPLPGDTARFNIRVRREGPGPIGEKDIAHQEIYVAARAATIGCLLDVASRVTSGPIEVTSLVRDLGYQRALRETNVNATTDVPTHALGLAFDIAIVNTPLATVLELREVLRQMSDAGDILVIAERQQLVFHVVPQPSRIGWYTEVYTRALTGQPWGRPAEDDRILTPAVSATIASLQPLPAWAAEWWAAENVPLDMPLSVTVAPDPTPLLAESDDRGMRNYAAAIGGFLSSTWRSVALWAQWSVG
jgi:hypothetical protein